MPTFNEAPETVRASLHSLVAQSFKDFECIVVDDSTIAECADACRAFCLTDARFIYIHPIKRLGLSSSSNLGLEMARGRLIARFDSDDLCMPDRLALQVEFLDANPQVFVLGGALEIIDEYGQTMSFRDYPLASVDVAKGMHFTTTIAQPTVMFRRELIAAYGCYNPAFPFSEDLDLWLRWLNAGVVFANLPQVLVRYRQSNTRRVTRHWRYNLRARVCNFAGTDVLRRIAGISCIAFWAVLPNAVQEFVFRALILRHKRRSGDFT